MLLPVHKNFDGFANMFYNALDSFAEREIGMKKIYLLLFLCACITLCVRVNGGIFIIQS